MKSFLMILIILLAFNAGFSQDKFHHMETTPKLNYDSLFADAVPIKKSEEGRAIIENCIERYGGEKHIESLNSFQLSFKMKPFAKYDSIDVIKMFQKGRKFKIVRNPEDLTRESIINGNESWFQSQDTLYTVEGKQYKMWLFSYLSSSMPLPLLTGRFDNIRFGKRENSPLDYIYMDIKDSLLLVIGIDPSDRFIKSSEGIIRNNDNNSVYIIRFSDFREYDGYYFPTILRTSSLGLEVSVSRLSDISVNIPFKDDEFMPDKYLQQKKRIDIFK